MSNTYTPSTESDADNVESNSLNNPLPSPQQEQREMLPPVPRSTSLHPRGRGSARANLSNSRPTRPEEVHFAEIDEVYNEDFPEKKRQKNASVVWEYFKKFEDDDGVKKAQCTLCDAILKADPKDHGTSSLRCHMTRCLNKSQSGASQSELHFGDGSLSTWRYNQDAARKSLAIFVIKDEHPFRVVEGDGFKEMMGTVQPKFKIPSRWTVARDCFQVYDDEKKTQMKLLREGSVRVCLTTDTWTSIQNKNYMSLTCHYIDNQWKLHKKIINFVLIDSHKGEAIGKIIERCLKEWGIDKVFTITVDNAGSNSVAISYLKKKWTTNGTALLGGKYLHMRCVAHILNLIVTDGMKDSHLSISRIRNAVKYVRQTPARWKKFCSVAEQDCIEVTSNLCLDVCTRWNSTYLMLEAAVKYQKVFEAMEDADSNYKHELMLEKGKDGSPIGLPDSFDWEVCKTLNKVLKKFYDLTLAVSGTISVSSTSYLEAITSVYATLNSWLTSTDPCLRDMGKRMKEKFDKYWGNVERMNTLLYVTSFLDPRKKQGFVKLCLDEMYSPEIATKLLDSLMATMLDLCEAYSDSVRSGQDELTADSSNVTVNVSDSADSEGLAIGKDIWEKWSRSIVDIGRDQSELDCYLQQDDRAQHRIKNFCILNWWKLNQHRYPVLSRIARDVFAVPISTVASESAFSTGGRVVDSYRSSLSPKMVQALICCQDWLRGSKVEFDIEDDIEGIDCADIGPFLYLNITHLVGKLILYNCALY